MANEPIEKTVMIERSHIVVEDIVGIREHIPKTTWQYCKQSDVATRMSVQARRIVGRNRLSGPVEHVEALLNVWESQ